MKRDSHFLLISNSFNLIFYSTGRVSFGKEQPKKHSSLAFQTGSKISFAKDGRVGGTIFERQSELESDDSDYEDIDDVIIEEDFIDPMKEV